MRNSGVIVANDVHKERQKATIFNLERMGVKNCITINFDGKKLTQFNMLFDRVLLDAPCTGLGVISRD